jgi:hypothetical protein
VQSEVRAVLLKRTSLDPSGCDRREPEIASLSHGDSRTVSDVNAFAHFHRSRRREGISFLLADELLGAALALAVLVVDLPRLSESTFALAN